MFLPWTHWRFWHVFAPSHAEPVGYSSCVSERAPACIRHAFFYKWCLCCMQVLLALMGLITVVAVAHSYFKKPSETVYLVDFAVHKSLDEWRFPLSWFIPASAKRGVSTG